MVGIELEGKLLQKGDGVHPCWAVLPIGYTWSLYFAQLANEHRAAQSLPALVPILRGRGPPLVWTAGEKKQAAYYVYVDNLVGMAAEAEGATSMVATRTHDFESVYLLLHRSAVLCGDAEALGVRVDGANLRSGRSD